MEIPRGKSKMPECQYTGKELAIQSLPGTDFDTANAFVISHVNATIANHSGMEIRKPARTSN